MRKFIARGKICDIGCSTGEFLEYIDWDGEAFGMEINDAARKIASTFINFERNIFTEKKFFDAVLFRGTIQHVDEPFRFIKQSYKALKNGGYLFFLATPNADSILYRLKKDLPFLDWYSNFWVPGEKELRNTLTNFGFQIEAVEKPYLSTPYSKPITDHIKFLLNMISPRFYPHAFWGSSICIAGRKLDPDAI